MPPKRLLAELFYELRARSTGLQSDLKAAETQFGKLSAFVKANPVAAITALGTAVAGVAIQAAKMAAQVEGSLRRVASSVPNGIAGLDHLRDGVAAVSQQTGKSQLELAENLREIARLGAEGPEQAVLRLKAVQTAVDATGEEFNNVVEGLDQTLDLFGGSSEDAARALGSLFAAAKGRTSLTDLFASLKAAAPAINNLKLDLDTAARALVALGEQGLSAKQAASELNKLGASGDAGRAAITKLADSIPPLTDGFADMQKAATDFNNSIEQLNKRALNDFQSVMLDLGRVILPSVTATMRDFVNLVDLITGSRAKRIKDLGLTDIGVKFAESVRENTDALQVQTGSFVRAAKNLSQLLQDGQLDIVATTTEGAEAVAAGIQHLVSVGVLKAEEVEGALKRLKALTTQAKGAQADLRGGKSGATASDIDKAGKAAKEAAKEVDALAERLTKLGTAQQFATGEAKLTGDAYADFAADLIDAQRKFPKFSEDLDLMQRRLFQLRQAASAFEQIELGKAVEEFERQHFGPAIADVEKRFDELLAKLEKAPNPAGFAATIALLKSQRDQTVDASKAVDDLAVQFEKLRDTSLISLGVADQSDLDTLLAMSAAVEAVANNEKVANDVREKAKALLKDINGELEKFGENLFTIPSRTEKINKGLSSTTRNLLEGADAAVALANAMGLVGDETAQALAATIQLGTSIAEIVATKGKEGVAGAIGAALKLGQIAFGKDPAAEQRAKELQKNTEQLARLNRNVGDLIGSDIPGTQFARVQGGLEALIAKTGTAGGFRRFGDDGPLRNLDPKRFFESLGLDFDEVVEIANQFGIVLNGTKQSYLDLLDAIKKRDLELFLDSFAGKLSQLEATLDIEGVTDPIERFVRRAQLLAETSPLFAEIFKGLDLTSIEGRAEAAKRLREQWEAFMKDPEAFRAALEASGLSLDEWREQMLEMNDALSTAASLVDRFTDALADIDVDLEIAGITDPTERARRAARAAADADEKFAALLGFNLATAEGRRAAEKFLQNLAAGANDELKAVILELLREIRAIPDAIEGQDGESVIVSNAARGLTETTGNRMADYLATANILGRQEIALLTEIRNILIGGAPVPSLVQSPSFSSALGAGAIVSGASVSVTVGDIIVQATGNLNDTGAAQSLAAQLSPAVIRQISEGLARLTRGNQRASGIVVS